MLKSTEYLGLADINDEDNYIDLCLKLSNSDITDITTHGLDVRVFSTRKCNYIVPPKGDCLSEFHPGNCGDVQERDIIFFEFHEFLVVFHVVSYFFIDFFPFLGFYASTIDLCFKH